MRLPLFVAVALGALALGAAPKQDAKPATGQQAKTSGQPAPVTKEPASGSGKQSGCPGTRVPQLSCEALTAEATMRQADIATDQTSVMWWGNWLGFATAFVAGLAAWFARNAAKASRDTVNILTEVEQASIVVTLEDFKEANGRLDFKMMANNLGRSSALIVHAGAAWHDSMVDYGNLALAAPPKAYIVKSGASEELEMLGKIRVADLGQTRFLWLLVIYNSPLRGQRFIRYCFEVWGLNSNVAYIERSRKEWDPREEERKWWRRWQASA